jgi:hypothetical protein
MPTKILVRCKDADSKPRREAAAERVVECFGKKIPNLRLLCFFDDDEWDRSRPVLVLLTEGSTCPCVVRRRTTTSSLNT